ncbi:MAG: cytochrome P450 [Acidimicrobiales bacterium]
MSIDRCPVAHGVDFTDPDRIQAGVPLPEFAWLRENRPLYWNPQTRENSSFDDGGFWLATRHEDVKAISCARDGWSSEENTAIVKFEGTIGKDERDIQKQMMLNMDDPHHAKVRGVVARGVFTPRGVAKIEDALRDRANQICIEAKAKGQGNFVEDVACELPLQALADLMGFPQDDRKQIFDWSNQMMAYDDPDFEVDPAVAAAEILGYAMTIGETRKACPADDIITKLVDASTSADTLTTDEFAWFILMLAVAGNETTRNAISHGMHAFMNNPEQWEIYKAERPETAADEIVRWATPVVMFQRTAQADSEVGGQLVKAGQRVGLVYSSANFDDTVFEDPHSFNILRDPNPHVGFGGGGAHFCVGANLAKVEINLMFNAIADNIPDIRQLAEPSRLRSGWLNALKDYQVTYG